MWCDAILNTTTLLKLLKIMITTKTGDDGTTSLCTGKRVSKSDSLIEAIGSIDELSSYLGLVIEKIKTVETKQFVTGIQKDLYHIMSYLSGSEVGALLLKTRVLFFEKQIDKIEKDLPKLGRFILPQGTEISVLFHIARTICRRAERNLVAANRDNKEIIQYINRLSDLLFVLARYYNTEEEVTI